MQETSSKTVSVTFDRLGLSSVCKAAAALANALNLGDCVVLAGPLAAGKTTFVQALARALGETDPITSPTFTLAHFYSRGRLPLLHVDAYRLENVHDFTDLALDDFYDTHVTAIEWGEKFSSALPPAYHVELTPDGDETRRLTLSAPGEEYIGLNSVVGVLQG